MQSNNTARLLRFAQRLPRKLFPNCPENNRAKIHEAVLFGQNRIRDCAERKKCQKRKKIETSVSVAVQRKPGLQLPKAHLEPTAQVSYADKSINEVEERERVVSVDNPEPASKTEGQEDDGAPNNAKAPGS